MESASTQDAEISHVPDPVDEATNLLISWNLPQLCQSFRAQEVCINALRDLTDDDLYELIPKIGPRSIFRARLQEWRQQQSLYENMENEQKDHGENGYLRTEQYLEQHPAQSLEPTTSNQILIESQQQLYHQHHNLENVNTSTLVEDTCISPTTAYSIDSGIKIETIDVSEEDWHEIGVVKIPEKNIEKITNLVNENGTTAVDMLSYTNCATLFNLNNSTAKKDLKSNETNLNTSEELCELSDSLDELFTDDKFDTKDCKKPAHRHLSLNVLNILIHNDKTKHLVNSTRSKSLHRIDRTKVVEVIVSHIIDKGIVLDACCFPFIVEQIVKIFPREKVKSYYNNSLPNRCTGLFITKYRREKLLLRKLGMKRYQEKKTMCTVSG